MFFFAVWAGAQAPPKQQKKKHATAQTEKKSPRPFRACFFFAVWAGGCVYFFAVWAGVVFFLLFGRGSCSFFAVWAGACSFFCCLGGGVFFFLLFGPGACFFFAVWAGDGSSLTYPSAWLVFKRPNNKRDRTAKKNTGSELAPKTSTHQAGKPRSPCEKNGF